ncbi:MAG TPA: extracellular solute-binding protein [Spirochaetia bacterium]|nr:extracellular solute-binding protein [Spirochaetia bacterium]
MRRTLVAALAALVLMGMGGSLLFAADKAASISVWSWKSGDFWEKVIIPTMKDKYNISVDNLVIGDYGQYTTKLKVAASAGELPDVLGLDPPDYLLYMRDYLAPLDAYYVRDFGSNWKNRYVKSLLDQALLASNNGEMLAVLMGISEYFPWYNTKVFKDLGITQLPRNLNDLAAASKKLRAAGYGPLAFGGADEWQSNDLFRDIAADFDPKAVENAEKGTMKWTDPVFVNVLKTVKRMVDLGIFQDGVWGDHMYMTLYDLFNQGKFGMARLGSWHATVTTPDFEAPMGISGFDYNGDGKVAPSIGSPDVAWTITKDSPNKDAAWKLIRWLGFDGGEWLTTMVGLTSQNKDFSQSHLPDKMKPYWDLTFKFAQTAVRRNSLYAELSTAQAKAVQGVGTGTMTPEQAAKQLQSDFDAIPR